MSKAYAPGKLILCGEHAVVYGRPAIALPIGGVRAEVEVVDGAPGGGVVIEAYDLRRCWALADDRTDPLSELVAHVLEQLRLSTNTSWRIRIHSTIPIAAGMGSGAAVSTALVRALARHAGHDLSTATIAALVAISEQRLHGTLSGIDQSVIIAARPIWFLNTPGGAAVAPVDILAPLTLLIGDTGIRSETYLPVGAVRQCWRNNPALYEKLFDAVGALAGHARAALALGDITTLGVLLNENHTLLRQIGVSSLELNRLVAAAQNAGALGAKLSGAGWGGVMIALVTHETRDQIAAALLGAGAARVLATEATSRAPQSAAHGGASARTTYDGVRIASTF